MAAVAAILDIESPRFEQPCIYWLSRCSIPNFSSIRQAVLEKKSKIDFQDGRRGGHIGNRIATIWTTVHLLVVPMLHTKFQLNPTSGSGEEVENRFSRWPPWRPYWISDRNDLNNREPTHCPEGPRQVWCWSVKRFGRRSRKCENFLTVKDAYLKFWFTAIRQCSCQGQAKVTVSENDTCYWKYIFFIVKDRDFKYGVLGQFRRQCIY